MNHSFCPVCLRAGLKFELLEIRTSVGELSGMCSNVDCTFPFESYAGLSAAVCKENQIKEQNEKNSWADFMDELFGQPDEPTGLPFENISPNQEFQLQPQLTDCNYDQEALNLIPESFPEMLSSNGLLPRYIADSLKQGHGTSPIPNDSNFDSGVSTSSIASYHESLSMRAHKRVVETQACLSHSKPAVKSTSKSLIEQLLDVHQPDRLNPHP
uniref:Uncharacterized protein n=1 Tax=Schistocephalus solidus TaxID=70667 RepID=A0A0X3NZX5_SCHSO